MSRIWAKKLQQSGFEDIETSQGELKTRSADVFRRRGERDSKSLTTPFEVRDYFLAISHYVTQAKFENALERKIMELYADGLGACEIQRAIRNRLERKTIAKIIQRHLTIFGFYGE